MFSSKDEKNDLLVYLNNKTFKNGDKGIFELDEGLEVGIEMEHCRHWLKKLADEGFFEIENEYVDRGEWLEDTVYDRTEKADSYSLKKNENAVYPRDSVTSSNRTLNYLMYADELNGGIYYNKKKLKFSASANEPRYQQTIKSIIRLANGNDEVPYSKIISHMEMHRGIIIKGEQITQDVNEFFRRARWNGNVLENKLPKSNDKIIDTNPRNMLIFKNPVIK